MIQFGEFTLDSTKRRLWKRGQEVMLAPKAMDVLSFLADRAGNVVPKEEIFAALWPGTFVSDHALTVQIREIRRALGVQSDGSDYIETRHRRGYRFVAAAIRVDVSAEAARQLAGQEEENDNPGPASAPREPFRIPETQYARSGDVSIAYQVAGSGPVDIVFVMGWVSHLEYFWAEPHFSIFLQRLAAIGRLIVFDKRGTGLSDRVPVDQLPTLEQRMDDLRAVMDAAGSRAAVIVGVSEGGPMSALFAATYPAKTIALVMIGTYAKRIRDETYPWGPTMEQREQFLEVIRREWGGPVGIEERAPSLAHDPEFRRWWSTYLRMGASPSAAIALTRMNAEIDARHVLEAVRVPTLVLHRSDDRCLLVEEGRYVASHIPHARFVELPGADHLPFAGNQDDILNEIEDFVAGVELVRRPERVLATVLCVGFREKEGAADPGRRRILAARLLQEIEWFRGKPQPSGLAAQPGGEMLLASFDGPARALRCAHMLVRHATRHGYQPAATLHTGECELRGDHTLAGLTVEVAKLMLPRAGESEILASSTVRDLAAGSGIRFVECGLLNLEGVNREWRLFRVPRGGAEV